MPQDEPKVDSISAVSAKTDTADAIRFACCQCGRSASLADINARRQLVAQEMSRQCGYHVRAEPVEPDEQVECIDCIGQMKIVQSSSDEDGRQAADRKKRRRMNEVKREFVQRMKSHGLSRCNPDEIWELLEESLGADDESALPYGKLKP